MKRSIAVLLLAAAVLSGCFTAEKLQPGAGTKLQVRGKTYDQVWAAAVQTASRDLNLLEQDKQRGIIKADSTITFLTLGELVGIYISPTTPNAPSYTVSVESIRKGVFQTSTAQDRTQAMISGMKLELGQVLTTRVPCIAHPPLSSALLNSRVHRLVLKPGREKSLKRRHPWVFSGAAARVEGDAKAGDTIEVRSGDGDLLALAAYSPHSQIRARAWAWSDVEIDASFFQKRIEDAASARAAMDIDAAGNGMRLLHAEADGLPGVIADRYGETVVVQLLSAGADRWREAIADALCGLPGVQRVWERSDADARELEGLKPRSGLLRGAPLPGAPVIEEHGLKFRVEVDAGHKTGFYLDQRDNRLLLRSLAAGKDVLDCFSYTGGFALNALRGGASSVMAVDSSALALDSARANATLNGLGEVDWREGDAFQSLRRLRDQGRTFDLIVLDPPKLAPTAAHAERASRAYKDVNLFAFKMLRPGGHLMTYSCSGGVSADLFQKIVAGAALDAGVDARIERWLHAAPDHPVALNFPESEYLKGLLCRVAAVA